MLGMSGVLGQDQYNEFNQRIVGIPFNVDIDQSVNLALKDRVSYTERGDFEKNGHHPHFGGGTGFAYNCVVEQVAEPAVETMLGKMLITGKDIYEQVQTEMRSLTTAGV